MQKPAERLPSRLTLLRVGLAFFVLAWLGPYTLRSAVPIWLPFLVALGLEVHFFVGALRPAPARRPDRGPQTADRERYGYGNDAEELLLVRDQGEELWIPYRRTAATAAASTSNRPSRSFPRSESVPIGVS